MVQSRVVFADASFMAVTLMVIRRPDSCAECGHRLPSKTCAWWDSTARTVTCTTCHPTAVFSARSSPGPLPPPGSGSAVQTDDEASAAQQRAIPEAAFGDAVIGDVTAHIMDQTQSAAARAVGPGGDADLTAHLDRDLVDVATVLHDRRVSGNHFTIDHLVVAPTGVWVIHARNEAGRVERRNAGDRRRPEFGLFVKGRDRTTLIGDVTAQADAVRRALGMISFSAAPVHRALCFTAADWRVLSRPFTIDDVWIGWPHALTKEICSNAVLEPVTITPVAQHLDARFPPSS